MALQNQHDFVFLFDVTNGNPNGDPDAGNMPRVDPMTNHGLVTDVCLKRKVRNHVALTKGGSEGHDIYVAERAILELQQAAAWDAENPASAYKDKNGVVDRSRLPKEAGEARKLARWMCDKYYDIRAFGAVMSTRNANCGQVRGPAQFAFARSVEPILPIDVTITRMAVTTEKDADAKGDNRTMGRKHIVPYGLYRAHGFISAALAGGDKGTGFSEADLETLWDALYMMFEHDRSAARGEMAARKLVVFKHDSIYGNAPAHTLFDRVAVKRVVDGAERDLNSVETPAREYGDYGVHLDAADLPAGVELIERF